MVPTIVSLVLPLSASRAHFLRKSAEMTMWGHFRRKSSKSQEWFLPATCPQVTSDASNLLRHVPWAFGPDYCLFGFASIGLQSSFSQKKCQNGQKVPFFWPPIILYSFGESKKTTLSRHFEPYSFRILSELTRFHLGVPFLCKNIHICRRKPPWRKNFLKTTIFREKRGNFNLKRPEKSKILSFSKK